jgi:hypothetical protein
VEPETLAAVSYATTHGGFAIRTVRDAEARARGVAATSRVTSWFAPPSDAAGAGLATLRTGDDGACVFFEGDAGRLCAVQRHLGHDALPSACRHFPRIALLDPRGTFVKLSHFCPTAARLLFRDDVPVSIVTNAPAFPAEGEYEGLDARGVLPPLLRPGVLQTLEGHTAWEAFAVSAFMRGDASPDALLALVAGAAEEVRAWTPALGAVEDHVRRVAARWLAREGPPAGPAFTAVDAPALLGDVRGAVPSHPAVASPVDAAADGWDRWVADAWPTFAQPVGRFLATHAFANWVAYQGAGLRTAVRAIAAALTLLEVECVRACRAERGPLTSPRLVEAIRATDSCLLHLASPDTLTRRLSRHEARPLT